MVTDLVGSGGFPLANLMLARATRPAQERSRPARRPGEPSRKEPHEKLACFFRWRAPRWRVVPLI